MKLGTVKIDDVPRPVVMTDEERAAVLLSDLWAAADLGEAPSSVKEVLALGEDGVAKLRSALAAYPADGAKLDTESLDWLPPVPDPALVLGVAMNNRRLNNTAHVPPAGPMFFVKPQSSLTGHGKEISIGEDYGFTFPELELAVVIGRPARDVSASEALDYIAGYTIANDVTSQGLKAGDSIATEISEEKRRSHGYEHYFTWRRHGGLEDRTVYFTYHARSKGSDTFGPMGPYLTTADEIDDPDNLSVRGYVNGEMFAEDVTSSYSYSIGEIVAWASRYFTLNPGDIVMCGTAAKGTEAYPRAHHMVDMSQSTPVVEIEIDGLGRLRNHVRHFRHGER